MRKERLLAVLHFGRNVAERALEFIAEALESCDDADADESGDQAVLDCGGARLVIHETRNDVLHNYSLPIATDRSTDRFPGGALVLTAELKRTYPQQVKPR